MAKVMKRRCRTEKESQNGAVDPSEPYLPLIQEIEDTRQGPHVNTLPQLHGHSITKFLPSECENAVHETHNLQLFGYVMLRHASYQADKSQFVITGIQSYLQATSGMSHTQKSEYTYLRVLDKNADNKETILEALSWLHHEFDVGNSIQHLVVTGDAKTYTHL